MNKSTIYNNYQAALDNLITGFESQNLDDVLVMHATNNNFAGVKDALAKGADIHASSNAAILYATMHDNVEMVDYLLFSPELKIHATSMYTRHYPQSYHTPQIENFMFMCDSAHDTLPKIIRASFASNACNVMKYILTNKNIAEKPNVYSLHNYVTSKTSIEMVAFLLHSPELKNKLKATEYDLYENCVKQNNLPLLKYLLVDNIAPSINEYQLLINKLTVAASRSAKFDILMFLTNNKDLPIQPNLHFNNCAVLFNAMINKDHKVIEYLVFEKNIYVSKEDMHAWRHSVDDMSLLAEMLAARKLYQDLQNDLPTNNNKNIRPKV